MTETAYTGKDITVLEGLEPVRLRPGMYIGSTGARGLHHLVYEARRQRRRRGARGPQRRTSTSRSTPTTRSRCATTGRGIPVDMMEDQGLSALTVVLTKLHAGGKFGGDGYKVSGGLHGVGISVVNALSEWLVVEVRRDGKVHRQEFARGVPQGDVEVVGEAEETGTTDVVPAGLRRSSTRREFTASTLAQRLRETAFLTRGLRISLADERAGGKTEEFHYEGGISDFVTHVNSGKDPLHKHVDLLRGRERRRPGRDRDAVEQLLRRVGLLVREQHQHDRGRHASLGLPRGADRAR